MARSSKPKTRRKRRNIRKRRLRHLTWPGAGGTSTARRRKTGCVWD